MFETALHLLGQLAALFMEITVRARWIFAAVLLGRLRKRYDVTIDGAVFSEFTVPAKTLERFFAGTDSTNDAAHQTIWDISYWQ